MLLGNLWKVYSHAEDGVDWISLDQVGWYGLDGDAMEDCIWNAWKTTCAGLPRVLALSAPVLVQPLKGQDTHPRGVV